MVSLCYQILHSNISAMNSIILSNIVASVSLMTLLVLTGVFLQIEPF